MDVLEFHTASIMTHVGYCSCSSPTTILWGVVCSILVYGVDLLLSSLLTSGKIIFSVNDVDYVWVLPWAFKMVDFAS